nr:protein RBL-like isoform X2 [Cicer arietinum]
MSGKRITRIVLQQTPLQARLHPGSSTPSLCLTCPLSSTPMIVDLSTGNTTSLKVFVSDNSNGPNPASRNKCSDGSTSFTPTAACFSKYGNLVYVGNSKGEILVIDSKDGEVRAMVPISGGSVVKNIVFNRNGKYLLTNSNDRIIRIYENLLPLKDEVRALHELNENLSDLTGVEKLKAVGSQCLTLFREFQDSITKVHWKAPCFSGDGEWVIGGSASKGEHKIYIWDRAGRLVKILEGPKEAITDLVWHPVRPIVVSVSLNGTVYIWAKDYTENWSAFAPDFKELEENEEYVEREDEFDLIPETEKVKVFDFNEDEEIDIVTVEKDTTFSDSDMSEEELCFLPATPIRDVPEQQNKVLESSSKLVDRNNSGSPLSEDAIPNGHLTDHASSPVKDDAGGTRSKRKRKPSEKVLELQAEKVKKSSKASKSSKPKSKSLGGVSNGNGNRNSYCNELSDE